jgi:hypothetical protein
MLLGEAVAGCDKVGLRADAEGGQMVIQQCNPLLAKCFALAMV